MAVCHLCHALVYDTLETSVREKFHKKETRFQPVLNTIAKNLTKALCECMTDEEAYKLMVRDIHGYLPFVGKEMLQETFIKSVTPIRRAVGILESDLFDAGCMKLGAIRAWLQSMSFDLFVVALDIHLEHTGKKEACVPKGSPMAALQEKNKEETKDAL